MISLWFVSFNQRKEMNNHQRLQIDSRWLRKNINQPWLLNTKYFPAQKSHRFSKLEFPAQNRKI
jgi:hypothetical protein